jgi:protein involved in polysaccharide export with SLBB domain
MKKFTFFLCLSALMGCSALKPRVETAKSSGGQDKAEEAALASVMQNLQAKKSDYMIGGADLLEIQVFQQTELDRKLRVSQNGTITFPLVGTVKVGGLSVAQAEEIGRASCRERVS